MKIFISGMPGCGKSTLILDLIKELKVKKKRVAGIITPELRKDSREGFAIKDLASNKQAILASVKLKTGPRVSKYKVNIKGIKTIVIEFEKSFDKADVYIVDEVGPMELKSKEFEEVINKILKSDKFCILTIHRSLIEKYKKYGKVFYLTKENFSRVKEEITEQLT